MTSRDRGLGRLALLTVCSLVVAQINMEYESNDAESLANGPLNSGTRVNASLSSASDVDWFFFDVSPGSINISVLHAATIDFDFFLYKPTGSYVLSGQTSSPTEAGAYYATAASRCGIFECAPSAPAAGQLPKH
jgi:cyanophycinase